MARKAKDDYSRLSDKSGGKFSQSSGQPFEGDLKLFRSFPPVTQQTFIRALKHRKAILEKDWYTPGVTLIVVSATALILASTTMVPYALAWRGETQDLLKAADALGLDKRSLNPDALINYYTTALMITAVVVAVCAALLAQWNFVRTWRAATTSVWIEALEADVAATTLAMAQQADRSWQSFFGRRRPKKTPEGAARFPGDKEMSAGSGS
jgi:hypothetical protein